MRHILIPPPLVLLWLLLLLCGNALAAFKHPGVVVNRGQLDFVKAKIAQGAEPWTKAYNTALAGRYSNASYVPQPRAVVECGSSSKPDYGCTAEVRVLGPESLLH